MLGLFQKAYWSYSVYAGYPCYTCSKCKMSFGRVQPHCPACGKKVLQVRKGSESYGRAHKR